MYGYRSSRLPVSVRHCVMSGPLFPCAGGTGLKCCGTFNFLSYNNDHLFRVQTMLKPSPTLPESTGQATVASQLYQRLRADILLGELEPGSKLRLSALAQQYDAGAIPLREALNRLSAEQLVSQHD